MKRPLKIVLVVFLSVALITTLFFALFFVFYPTPKFSHQKLVKQNAEICFFDRFNNPIENFTLKNHGGLVDIDKLNDYTVNAFIAVEDKRFFKHNGIDFKGILRAVKNNIFSRSLKQGGSTISQQLIKNTHLSPEKTLGRKIAEIKLTMQLEKNYSKKQILQFYLNGIYFGEGCYGLQSASLHYFGKTADKLTLSESACLAGCVKAPSVYNPLKKECVSRRNTVLNLMYEQGYICESELKRAKQENIEISKNQTPDSYFSVALDEGLKMANVTPYFSGKLNIYTNFDQGAQDILNQNLSDLPTDKKGIICTFDGKILALYLPKGDFERMPASTIKPLLCYAPALENGKISLASKILDEKCDFGGYIPSNYGDKYNGWIDSLTAIKQSLNVPAVKILQTVGVKNAKSYVEKMGIEIKENSLNIALGAYSGGVALANLCTAYTTFLNGGNCFETHTVNRVEINSKTIFETQNKGQNVFRQGTCDLINVALKECAKSGTAKALCDLPFEVCAKTGTNGNASGNTDAYTVCYTSEHVFAFWLGNADNSPMENQITGGYTARIANNVLSEFYKNSNPKNFTLSNDVIKVKLCKFAYEQGKLLLKDKNAPERYCFESWFLRGFEPTIHSEEYSKPTLLECDFDVKNNCVTVNVQKNNHVYFDVLRREEGGNECIFENCESVFLDENLPNGKYYYTVLPFVYGENGQKIYGEKITLPQVKIQNENWFDKNDWWED